MLTPNAKIVALKYFFYHHSSPSEGHLKTRKKHRLQELTRALTGDKWLVSVPIKFAMHGFPVVCYLVLLS